MADYNWITHVLEDLEKFAEQENLATLRGLLEQARSAFREDEHILKLDESRKLECLDRENKTGTLWLNLPNLETSSPDCDNE